MHLSDSRLISIGNQAFTSSLASPRRSQQIPAIRLVRSLLPPGGTIPLVAVSRVDVDQTDTVFLVFRQHLVKVRRKPYVLRPHSRIAFVFA